MRNRKYDIERYLRGELSPSEMHALEREALSDPFLAEALEGIEHAGADNFLYDLHKLNRSVHNRMRKKARKNSKTIRIWGWTSAVAATILLLAVSGFLVVQILKDQQVREQSMGSKSDEPDSALSPEDSLTVEHADSSRLALGETNKPETLQDEPPQSAPAVKKDEGQKLKSQQIEKRSDQALADTSVPEQEDESVTEHTDADGIEVREEVASEGKRLALAEVTAKDSLIQKVPSADRVVARSEEAKVAGVQKQRTGIETRAAAAPAKTVKGKVISQDGHGLPGVNVIIDGTDRGTVTDAEGNYELVVPEDTRLVFAFIGFESQEVLPNNPELNITLEEDLTTLSEVVVTGYAGDKSSADPSSFRFAEPNGGRGDFKNYLENAVKYPQEAVKNKTEGKVTVTFTVQPNGKLTDFEVLNGIGSGCEEELIRAIQQGPYWKPSTRGEQPVKDKVKVRFKFNLPK